MTRIGLQLIQGGGIGLFWGQIFSDLLDSGDRIAGMERTEQTDSGSGDRITGLGSNGLGYRS